MSKLVSNNTYSNILQVSWDESNKYTAKNKIVKDPVTGERYTITTWQTADNTVATSGYYLSVDEQLDVTYIVKLLKLTFDEKGTVTNGTVNGTLYKLPSDFSFQDSESYYVKNSNNFEELKVNQGQCIFTADPTTDKNFYIYQKGIEPWTSAPPLPRLVYYDSGTKWYYPLITKTGTLTWNGYIYSYDKSIGDTFGVALNNTKYVVPNKRVAAYDIAPGTYTPSAFENLIKSFISNNGSRTVKNGFSVVVNGQTYSVPAGRAIYYTYQYSGQARFVCFNGSPRGSFEFQNSTFSQYGVYCTYWDYSNIQGDRYYQYNIKVNTGISFS